jgi:hypothetical protein
VTGVDEARKVLADRIANTLDSLPPAYPASSGGDLDMGIVVPLKALRTVLEAAPVGEWEYVPGRIGSDGRAFVQSGVIAPTYVKQFMAEGRDVLRRRVGRFEPVTDTTEVPDAP